MPIHPQAENAPRLARKTAKTITMRLSRRQRRRRVTSGIGGENADATGPGASPLVEPCSDRSSMRDSIAFEAAAGNRAPRDGKRY
jgi:hypothetical protein